MTDEFIHRYAYQQNGTKNPANFFGRIFVIEE